MTRARAGPRRRRCSGTHDPDGYLYMYPDLTDGP